MQLILFFGKYIFKIFILTNSLNFSNTFYTSDNSFIYIHIYINIGMNFMNLEGPFSKSGLFYHQLDSMNFM